MTFVKTDPKSLRTRALAFLAFAPVFAWIGVTNWAAAATFQTLDFPDAGGRTVPNDVSGANVVGIYYDTRSSVSPFHGFLYNGSTWASLDDPLATVGTAALGISGNTIVGYYAAGPLHGFIYDGTSYVTLDYPGALSTLATGVDDGHIVGYSLDASNASHGFRYDNGSFAPIDFPGAGIFGTRPSAIWGDKIVGSFFDQDFQSHGFLFDGINYVQLDVPAGSGTAAFGIWGNTIVGQYVGVDGYHHGYIYDGATYVTFDHPLAISVSFNHGIDGSTVVGGYDDLDGPADGFLTVVPEPPSHVLLTVAVVVLLVRRPSHRLQRSTV